MFGVNPSAANGTFATSYSGTSGEPVVADASFVVKEPVQLGGSTVTNTTYDLSSAFTTVNSVGCDDCYVAG